MSGDSGADGEKQVTGGNASPSSRPRRSGEGMESVLQHLREHLEDKARERPRDDGVPGGGRHGPGMASRD
jgi:hypothetical protein